MDTTTTIRNGIDVDQLIGTIDKIKDDPNKGKFTFRASSSWKDETHSKGAIQDFKQQGSRT